MKTVEFDYYLPPEMIAQTPIEPRDASRLLVLERRSGEMAHRHFSDLGEYLRPGDLLVANDSRVLPARLFGRKETGGKVEVFLLRQTDGTTWQALLGGRRLRAGTRLFILGPNDGDQASPAATLPAHAALSVTLCERQGAGAWLVQFNRPVESLLDDIGIVPLPPYIHEPLADAERYQTVYARVSGSVAAPTAGLHFTPTLIDRLQAGGVRFAFVTLHVGLDTFRPVKTVEIEDHPMHSEWALLPSETVAAVKQTRADGGRVVAVGTTAVCVLESAAAQRPSGGRPDEHQPLVPFSGWTDLFIRPGYRFAAVDAMITNFHLPRSTLLMLVAAFASKPFIDRAYQEAIDAGYRFYSFGDAMLIM